MHRDATTKKGRHFYGVEFSTGQKHLTAGLREVPDGKGETYVESIKEILQDITNTHSSDNSNVAKTISNTSYFMTDRSVTEQKVNNIIIKDRNDLLENTGEEKDAKSFKCSVHPLLQFSDVCQKEINKIEKDNDVNIEVCNENESITHFLLRCVSKLFYKDGSGDPLLSSTYIKSVGIKNIPIMNFRGNRFNTLFFNSTGTFYLHQHIVTYLKSSKSTLNYIQNFIIKSLGNKTILAIIRALGIISKIITEPYWNEAADESKTALEIGSVYRRLIDVLSEAIESPQLLLCNDIKLLYGPNQELDNISSSLFASSSTDSETVTFIKKFCVALKFKSESLFKDFILKGKYVGPSQRTVESSISCPSNNIAVERLMGKLDSKLKTVPNATSNNIESIILFKNNDTQNWLESKKDIEKSEIIKDAIKTNRNFIKQVKQRKKQLFDKRLLTIREREQCVKNSEERKQKNVDTALKDLNKFGLWNSSDKIRCEIEKYVNKKDKISALKKQINLYKTVFPIDKINKDLLLFSKNGKQHDVEKLINNLCKLIKIRQDVPVQCESKSITAKPTTLVGKTFSHVWTENGQDLEWMGKVCSNKKGTFKVQYWQKDETFHSSSECYELTTEEIDTYYRDGNFFFIEDQENFQN